MRGPKYPVAVEYLRRWLYELHGRSGYTGMGDIAPLSFTTIRDWSQLMQRSLEPWEVDFLLDADAILISEPARLRAEKEKKKTPLPAEDDDE